MHNNSVTPNKKKKQARYDLDDEGEKKDPESPNDKIEESKYKLLASIFKKEKISKESIKTQKVTNTSNFIIQLEP